MLIIEWTRRDVPVRIPDSVVDIHSPAAQKPIVAAAVNDRGGMWKRGAVAHMIRMSSLLSFIQFIDAAALNGGGLPPIPHFQRTAVFYYSRSDVCALIGVLQ